MCDECLDRICVVGFRRYKGGVFEFVRGGFLEDIMTELSFE